MLNKENDFDLNIRVRFPGGRQYAFACLVLFAFIVVIYGNSFQGQFVFDDTPNIVENRNIHLKSLDWPEIKKSFYGMEGKKISRPLSYFSLALNYYFGGLNVFGYHLVNFTIHFLSAIFLFLLLYNTLRLPTLRDRFGPAAYSIALVAVVLWTTSPLQVTAVTYIVQRMASMAGLFYIMAMYFYLKGRTADKNLTRTLFWTLCVFSGLLSFGSKENAVMLPFSIWLFDLLLIQGATRENIIRNLKILAPVVVVVGAIGLWYVDIGSFVSGSAYQNRPFTLIERLLTQPRIIIFYISLLLYPVGSRLTLIHDIELSTSLIAPWTTMPAIALILGMIALAGYLARRRPLISFAILFYFLNHVVESSFIALELIYEHRNYIPSMFFFVPIAIVMVYAIDYFSYKKTIQFTAATVFTFLMFAHGHTVLTRNALFAHRILLWTDNVEKTPTLSRTYNNLGAEYWNRGFYDNAYELYSKAESLDRQTNVANRGVNLYNLGRYYLEIKGEYDKALELFQSATELYSGHWPSYHEAAMCYMHKGNIAEAGNTLAAALVLWPENALLRYSLSLVLLKAGEYSHALKESMRALSLDPDLYKSLSVVAEAFRGIGKDKLATVYWERYLEKNPNSLEANFALMELYARQNRKDDISRTIGKVMALKGSKNWADLILQFAKDANVAAYTPSLDKIIPILRHNFNDQLSR